MTIVTTEAGFELLRLMGGLTGAWLPPSSRFACTILEMVAGAKNRSKTAAIFQPFKVCTS